MIWNPGNFLLRMQVFFPKWTLPPGDQRGGGGYWLAVLLDTGKDNKIARPPFPLDWKNIPLVRHAEMEMKVLMCFWLILFLKKLQKKGKFGVKKNVTIFGKKRA